MLSTIVTYLPDLVAECGKKYTFIEQRKKSHGPVYSIPDSVAESVEILECSPPTLGLVGSSDSLSSH